jgi:ADP-L-glycero-D-manno-heptose 6-epimerase
MFIVTGGAGFIGSVLVQALNRRGVDDILVVDTLGSDGRWKNLRGRGFRKIVPPDIFLQELSAGQFDGKVEAILHMGAITDTSEADADLLYARNTRYTQGLAAWAMSQDARFVYASSASVYGDGALGFSDDDALTPRLMPLNPYAFSKWLFDRDVIAHGWAERIAGLRFFNVFGPNEYHKGRMASVVWHATNQVREKGRIELFQSHRAGIADGAQQRDFVSVMDVAEVVLWFLDHPDANGIFNLGAGQARTFNDLAAAIFAALDRPAEIAYIPTPENIRDSYQYHTEADLAKLRAIGCKHQFASLEESVREYVGGFLSGPMPRYL